MPIDRFKTEASEGDGPVEFILRDPDNLYTHSEVCDLLEKAQELGYSLDKGTVLENMTVRELDVLVNRKQ